jgi:hypothetical protein
VHKKELWTLETKHSSDLQDLAARLQQNHAIELEQLRITSQEEQNQLQLLLGQEQAKLEFTLLQAEAAQTLAREIAVATQSKLSALQEKHVLLASDHEVFYEFF